MYPNEDIYIQNIKFSASSIICNFVLVLIRNQIPFTNLKWIHIVVILISMMYGLITSFVIKFGGSILKTYSVSSAMFFSTIISIIVFKDGKNLLWNFYVGSIFCYIAIHIYAQEIRRMKMESDNEVLVFDAEDILNPEDYSGI